MPKSKSYEEFVEKFKPKKTTDDCYTPPEVYDAVVSWVRDNIYPVKDEDIIRPFWPGGDYENTEYPDGCVVVDNPPFSILSKILDFYLARNIRFFLFAPALTLFNNRDCTFIVSDSDITYKNGAVVRTGFVTNMAGDLRVWLTPSLRAAIEKAQKDAAKPKIKIKNSYPDHLITSAILGKLVVRGIEMKIAKNQCVFVCNIDNLKACGRSLFGGGFLLSDRAAAERAAAERAAAERAAAERAAAFKIELSPREKLIVAELNKKG